MTFVKAGLWGPEAVIDTAGHPQPGATAAVYLSDGVTLAGLWTSSAKGAAMANPTQVDIHGNLHFYADPGPYVLKVTVGGTVTALTVEVPIDPGEAAQDQDVVAAQAAAEAYADGIMASGLATKQPLDADLTAIAALSTTAFGRSFLALADAAAGQTLLSLGTAATQPSTAFDAAGAAAAAQAASQPLDSDLTAIAALSTTAFGQSLLALVDAAALRTAAGLGSAATHDSADFDAAGTAAAAVLALINGAPGALDTLNELATALADDPNFATTITNALAAKSPILIPTAVKTGNYTAAVGDYVLCDTSGGIFTVTLPTAPADMTSIAVDLVASGNTLTIARGGADVFQKAGGPTSLTMNTANRVLVLQYQSSIAVWHVQDHLPAVITTKGDLLTYSTERARLAVGADGALLGADSSTATGLKWIPSGAYVLQTDIGQIGSAASQTYAASIAAELSAEEVQRAQGDNGSIAQAGEYADTKVNELRALIGGVTAWAPGTEYLTGTEVGFGTSAWLTAPPGGYDRVFKDLPPFGKGDGTEADHNLLMLRRAGYARSVTGGAGKPVYTVNSQADYVPGVDTPIAGTLRWAEAQCRTTDGGKIIFDKTANFGAGAGIYKIKLLHDFYFIASNVTYDARGADVTITGGDGTYAEGGQPGKSQGTLKTYSSTATYRGSADQGATVNNVPGGDLTEIWTGVDPGPALAGDANNPRNAPGRWWKQQTWTTGRSGIPQAARETDPSDGKLYVLMKPVGGYTTVGNTRISTGASSTRPGLDRHDLNPTTGHWVPVGKPGFTIWVGPDTFANFTATAGSTPSAAGGVPTRNVIFEKMKIVSNWGGEYGDDGFHRDLNMVWWSDNIWFDRLYITNPDRNHDQLIAWSNFGRVTATWCKFYQHLKAVAIDGTGGLITPKISASTQVNPALVGTYGLAATGYSMWNDVDNTTLYINKLTSTQATTITNTLALSAAAIVTAELDHGTDRLERVGVTALDTSNPNHDVLTVVRRLVKKHIAKYPFDGTGDATGTNPGQTKTCDIFTLPHFPPGYEDQYVHITDPTTGDDWVSNRITFDHCMFEEIGFRGPELFEFNMLGHMVNCYAKNWGSYHDTGLDDGTHEQVWVVHPCVPFSLAPVAGANTTAIRDAHLFVENSIFEPYPGGVLKAITGSDAKPGSLLTSGLLMLGGATQDPDRGSVALPDYPYSPDTADTYLKSRIVQAAGAVSLWTYEHESGLYAPVLVEQDGTTVASVTTLNFKNGNGATYDSVNKKVDIDLAATGYATTAAMNTAIATAVAGLVKVLASTTLSSGSQVDVDSTSGNTWQTIDTLTGTTSFHLSFVAPTGGAVDLIIDGLVRTISGSPSISVGVTDVSGTIQNNPATGVGIAKLVSSTTTTGNLSHRWRISGLTAGTTYTWYVAIKTTDGANTNKARFSYGGTAGQAMIEVIG